MTLGEPVKSVTVVAGGLVGPATVVEHAHDATDVLGDFCVAVAATAARAIDAVAPRVLIGASSARPTVG